MKILEEEKVWALFGNFRKMSKISKFLPKEGLFGNIMIMKGSFRDFGNKII